MEDTRDLGELICGTGFKATIVLDTATTGLGPDAELVAVTATDGWGNIVFDTFVKPSCHTEWPEAERIHHISPEAVAHAPQAKEIAPRLAELLGGYGLYVGYGTAFDLAMLQKNGAAIPAGLPVFDVMREFAKVHGKDVSGWRGRWSKLSECCAFYGGTEGSHGAKGGAEACAFCYRSLLETLPGSRRQQKGVWHSFVSSPSVWARAGRPQQSFWAGSQASKFQGSSGGRRTELMPALRERRLSARLLQMLPESSFRFCWLEALMPCPQSSPAPCPSAAHAASVPTRSWQRGSAGSMSSNGAGDSMLHP